MAYTPILNMISVTCFHVSHPRRAVQGPEVNQPPMGQEESELHGDQEEEGRLTVTSYQSQQGGLSPVSGGRRGRTPGLLLRDAKIPNITCL